MLIKGATGSNAGIINGGFEVAERPDNEPPIYQRVDGSDGWLFVNPRVNRWTVGDQQDKDTRTTLSRGRAQSVAEAVGRLPHEVGSAWQVLDREINKWAVQQLRVVDVEVSVYACTHARTHTHTHSQKHKETHAHTPDSLARMPCSLASMHICTYGKRQTTCST